MSRIAKRVFHPCAAALFGLAAATAMPVPVFADQLAKQIEIETKFVEVSQKSLQELGFDKTLEKALAKLPADASKLSSPDNNNLGLGSSPSASDIRNRLFPGTDAGPGLTPTVILTDDQMNAIIKAARNGTGAGILSAPPVMTSNNRPVALDIPPSIYLGGVRLTVTPQIAPDGSVMMSINPEESLNGPPHWLGNIPVIGTTMPGNEGKAKQDLIIFIVPHVVDALSHSDEGYESGDPVRTETISNGETIGHIADLKLQNMTDGSLVFMIPPLVFESKSGANQASCCPHSQEVKLAAHQTKTVPVDGICLDQKKPAADKGMKGELVMNTGDDRTGKDSDLHIPAEKVQAVIHVAESIYEAVDELAREGSFKDFPYKDKEEQKKIALQWGTWSNPRIAELTGNTPATKEDMKKVAKKQPHQPMNSNTEEKIDKGIDTIWEKIELTSEKAKDLEEPGEAEPAQQAAKST